MGDTPKVKLIPATKKDPRPIMTGIYARVSSARVEQLRSLSAQVSAMTRYVYWREGWILRDIYLDVSSAKTGSSRREFSRLLEAEAQGQHGKEQSGKRGGDKVF